MPIPHLSRRVATLVLQNSLAIALGAIDLDAQARDSLTVRVARVIEGEGLVGATWSLVTPTGITVGAAGLRDLARRTPMHPHDRVHVGSIAKTFVAIGVLRLVTEGRIDLDAPVARYLPDLPIENPWAETAPLRVRHLLDHTSGLGDARMWQVFTLRGDPDAPLRAGLARPGERLRLRYRPGARFTYSNPGYLIAAMLIEQVTGTRYEEWLERELLLPLGMSRSTFAFVSQVGRAADTTLAMGHFDGVTSHPAYAIPVRAATQFTTTAADMAIFARFLMSDGQVDGRRLVDSTLLRAMAVPTTTEAVQAGLGTGYGLGLVHRERWGITGKCHLGNLGTFRALLCMYPEHQRALFVSINTDPEGANFDRVDSLLAAALDVPPIPVAPAAAPGVDVAAWEGWYVVRPNRFAQFAYLDALGGVTRIDWDGDALNLRPLQGTARVLRPVGGALFRIDERRAATHVLTLSSDGVPVVTDGLRTLERVPRWRVALSWLSAAAGVVALLYLLLGRARADGAGVAREGPPHRGTALDHRRAGPARPGAVAVPDAAIPCHRRPHAAQPDGRYRIWRAPSRPRARARGSCARWTEDASRHPRYLGAGGRAAVVRGAGRVGAATADAVAVGVDDIHRALASLRQPDGIAALPRRLRLPVDLCSFSSCADLALYVQTSWEICRHHHFVIPLGTGRRTLRKPEA